VVQKGERMGRRRKAAIGGLAGTLGVLGVAAIRVVRALPLAEDAEPEHVYPSRMAKKKDAKKMGSGPRTRRKKQKKGK
jgi:hypothetical protein